MISKEIKQLPLDFIGRGQVRGFKFSQINSTINGFLYKVNSGDTIYYEVFKRRVNTQYNCVSYPTDKAFGLWAWTTPDFNKAIDYLNKLDEVKEVNNG